MEWQEWEEDERPAFLPTNNCSSLCLPRSPAFKPDVGKPKSFYNCRNTLYVCHRHIWHIYIWVGSRMSGLNYCWIAAKTLLGSTVKKITTDMSTTNGDLVTDWGGRIPFSSKLWQRQAATYFDRDSDKTRQNLKSSWWRFNGMDDADFSSHWQWSATILFGPRRSLFLSQMMSDNLGRCSLRVLWVLSGCSPSVPWLCSECSLGVLWVFSSCFLSAYDCRFITDLL